MRNDQCRTESNPETAERLALVELCKALRTIATDLARSHDMDSQDAAERIRRRVSKAEKILGEAE